MSVLNGLVVVCLLLSLVPLSGQQEVALNAAYATTKVFTHADNFFDIVEVVLDYAEPVQLLEGYFCPAVDRVPSLTRPCDTADVCFVACRYAIDSTEMNLCGKLNPDSPKFVFLLLNLFP